MNETSYNRNQMKVCKKGDEPEVSFLLYLSYKNPSIVETLKTLLMLNTFYVKRLYIVSESYMLFPSPFPIYVTLFSEKITVDERVVNPSVIQ